MQGAFEEVRFSLWDRLKPVFEKYAEKESEEINTSRV